MDSRVVVIGLGMVAISFIEKLLSRSSPKSNPSSPQYTITAIGDEPHLAYNRVGLSQYFNGRSVTSLLLNPESWYQEPEIKERLSVRLGLRVQNIDTTNKLVRIETGEEVEYDICVVATGSRASVPPYIKAFPHLPRGCFVYRSIGDLDSLAAYIENDNNRIKRAVVVGGGLLGLEAAKAVLDLQESEPGTQKKDFTVTVIERNAHVLARQLDVIGGEMVQDNVKGLGIEVMVQTRIRDVIVTDNVFKGLIFEDGTEFLCEVVVFAVGITPNDDITRASGITVHDHGGILVTPDLLTSAPSVYAIGECAHVLGGTYGLIAPGIHMADVLSFNLTDGPTHSMRAVSSISLDSSVRLKLLGVHVASFGNFFADRVKKQTLPSEKSDAEKTRNKKGESQGVKTLVYHDAFGGIYKKYLFTADGKKLLGGMMVGDTNDYTRLLAMAIAGKPLEVPPGQLILGVQQKEGELGEDLDDSAQVCSCHNVSKGDISKAVSSGTCKSIGEIKSCTKAGTGCGGCMPLVTSIFNTAMKKAGQAVSDHICIHFKYSRVQLFHAVKIRRNLRTFPEVMRTYGTNPRALGCEVCKPALASIFASLYNEPILSTEHAQNQDTNDRYLANIQRDGSYSVVPRIPGGEITPDKLRVIADVAKEYNLYTKITGGQRIDLFGAHKADLPRIWEKLRNEGGLESGQAYAKSLRTVKSCVGSTWCRYGLADSVKLAIQLEERYKGMRSPHKFKGGVSGCVRECAEAQAKDFGLIATQKGWNVFVGGNGGAKPRHATLLATDVPKAVAVRLLDRFLMFYIQTADRLMRTARWLEALPGGIEYLRKVIIDDELGICAELDRDIDALVDSYYDEWAVLGQKDEAADGGKVEKDKRFKQFANTDEREKTMERVSERDQMRPVYWPLDDNKKKFTRDDLNAPDSEWTWQRVCALTDLRSKHGEDRSAGAVASSVAVKVGKTQLAIFYVPTPGKISNGEGFKLYATQNMCPHRRAFVLSDGIVGDDGKGSGEDGSGNVYVSCPLHKRNFCLSAPDSEHDSNPKAGACLSDADYGIITFAARHQNGDIYLRLPPQDALDELLATEKWIVRAEEAEGKDEGSVQNAKASVDIEIINPPTDEALIKPEATSTVDLSQAIKSSTQVQTRANASKVLRHGLVVPPCGSKLEW